MMFSHIIAISTCFLVDNLSIVLSIAVWLTWGRQDVCKHKKRLYWYLLVKIGNYRSFEIMFCKNLWNSYCSEHIQFSQRDSTIVKSHIYGRPNIGKTLNWVKMQCMHWPDSAEERLDLGTVKQNPRCRDKEQRKVSYLQWLTIMYKQTQIKTENIYYKHCCKVKHYNKKYHA